MENTSKNQIFKSMELLEDAIKICVEIRVINDDSQLAGNVIDRTLVNLLSLYVVLRREANRRNTDSQQIWDKVNRICGKIVKFLINVL